MADAPWVDLRYGSTSTIFVLIENPGPVQTRDNGSRYVDAELDLPTARRLLEALEQRVQKLEWDAIQRSPRRTATWHPEEEVAAFLSQLDPEHFWALTADRLSDGETLELHAGYPLPRPYVLRPGDSFTFTLSAANP